MDEFLDLPAEYHPFGKGPWPCLNPASDHYREPLVQECDIRISYRPEYPVGRPIGTFACACGFVYNRSGPDRSPEDRFRRSRQVQSYGPVWEAALKRLWEDPDISLGQIARQLGGADHTVKCQAARLGLSFSHPQNRSVLVDPKRQLKPKQDGVLPSVQLNAYRTEWLTAREENPNAGRHELQKRFKRVSSWLRRHDAEWLESHMPPCRKSNQPRVDWQSRDIQLAADVKSAAVHLRTAPGCPIKITKNAIAREINMPTWLLRKPVLEKLPLTSEVCAIVIETPESFALRRIRWAIERYREEDICPVHHESSSYSVLL